MKTKAQVIKEHPELKTLINAVVNKIGIRSVRDINRHGIDGGFNGFVYYDETHRFAMKHRKTIIELLYRDAADFNQEIVEMISHFRVFREASMDIDDKKDLYQYLGSGKCEQGTITNLMAWYAAETVCRMFED